MRRAPLALASLILVSPVLAACGGGEEESLPAFSATSSTSAPDPSTSPSTSATTATATATATEVAGEGVEFSVTLAPGLTGQPKAAGEAYGDYWTFVGETLEKPPLDISKAGEFVAGDALGVLSSLAERRVTDGVTTSGTAQLTVTKVTVAGSAATVCAQLQDLTATFRGGKLVQAPDGQQQTFKAGLKLDGPTWRTYTSTEVDRC